MPEDNIINLDTLDLTKVDTGFPIVPAGLYQATVAEIRAEPNNKGTGQNLKIKLTLNEPTNDLSGNPTNPGFPIFDLISLVESRDDSGNIKYDPRKRLAAFKEGVTGNKEGSFNPLEQYLGMTCTIRVKVEDDPEYGKSNRVNRYVKKA